MRGDRGSNRPEAWQALGRNPARRWIDALLRGLYLIVDIQLVVPGVGLIANHPYRQRDGARAARAVVVRSR